MSEKKLTEAELNNFLGEIQDQEKLKEIAAQEAAELEELYPGEDLTTDNAWSWANKSDTPGKEHYRGFSAPHLHSVSKAIHIEQASHARAMTKNKNIEIREKKKQIIEEALCSETIDLDAPLTVYHKKLIIESLVKNTTERLRYWEKFVNKTIEIALKASIPTDLMSSWKAYPEKVVPFDKFTYTASKEYGQGLTFVATPHLPDYFKPEACQNIVYNNLTADRLMRLDKAIVSFHKFKEKRMQNEVKTATALVKITTFMQLLNKKPLWYEKLIELLEKDNDNA